MVGVCITVSGVQSLSHSPWNIIQEGKKYTLSTFFSLFFSTRYDTKPDKSWWRKKTCLKASHLKVKFMWCESLIFHLLELTMGSSPFSKGFLIFMHHCTTRSTSYQWRSFITSVKVIHISQVLRELFWKKHGPSINTKG